MVENKTEHKICSTKHTHKAKDLATWTPLKGWTRVLRKGQQYILHIWQQKTRPIPDWLNQLQNGQCRYKYLALWMDKPCYFFLKHSDSNKDFLKLTESICSSTGQHICSVLEDVFFKRQAIDMTNRLIRTCWFCIRLGLWWLTSLSWYCTDIYNNLVQWTVWWILMTSVSLSIFLGSYSQYWPSLW